jgi:hypothetical protein
MQQLCGHKVKQRGEEKARDEERRSKTRQDKTRKDTNKTEKIGALHPGHIGGVHAQAQTDDVEERRKWLHKGHGICEAGVNKYRSMEAFPAESCALCTVYVSSCTMDCVQVHCAARQRQTNQRFPHRSSWRMPKRVHDQEETAGSNDCSRCGLEHKRRHRRTVSVLPLMESTRPRSLWIRAQTSPPSYGECAAVDMR